METACEAFEQAVAAFAEGDRGKALARARRALELEPASLLYASAARYLRAVDGPQGAHSVYSSADAFSAFTSGGGNVPLYHSVARALAKVYGQYQALHLLDIGVGHGMALLPALTPQVQEVTAVEPSAVLLERTRLAMEQRGVPFHGHCLTLQELASRNVDRRWKLAQATFSLQSLEPAERVSMLGWLREHCDRLLIVEFDVPTFSSLLHPAHVGSVARRYERGLAEYGCDTRELVAQGFLMPVMFGYFQPGKARTNYEHSLETWVEQVQLAGFATVVTRPLYDYWWGTAHLLDARACHYESAREGS